MEQGYDLGQKAVRAFTPNRPSPSFSTTEYAVAGFISAIPQTFVAAPVERAKVLLQIQGQSSSGDAKYKGVLDVVRGLYKEGGIRSIFRGTGATLARDGPGSAACVQNRFTLLFFIPCGFDYISFSYFAGYEITKKALTPAGSSPSDLNLGTVIFAGGMAGVAMWSIAIPPDVCVLLNCFTQIIRTHSTVLLRL